MRPVELIPERPNEHETDTFLKLNSATERKDTKGQNLPLIFINLLLLCPLHYYMKNVHHLSGPRAACIESEAFLS